MYFLHISTRILPRRTNPPDHDSRDGSPLDPANDFIDVLPFLRRKQAPREQYHCRYYRGERRRLRPQTYDQINDPKAAEALKTSFRPKDTLPVCTPELSAADSRKLYVTWFGHSSVLMQMSGVNILIDPMFSEYSSPVPVRMLRRFSRPSVGIDSLPHIDAVLLTHDHYDHLDKRTIKALADKADRFIVSSGAERHLRKWGIPNDRIISLKYVISSP